jgi:hypothetical protein
MPKNDSSHLGRNPFENSRKTTAASLKKRRPNKPLLEQTVELSTLPARTLYSILKKGVQKLAPKNGRKS